MTDKIVSNGHESLAFQAILDRRSRTLLDLALLNVRYPLFRLLLIFALVACGPTTASQSGQSAATPKPTAKPAAAGTLAAARL